MAIWAQSSVVLASMVQLCPCHEPSWVHEDIPCEILVLLQVVLTSTVPKLGQQGELISVQNGFVTNYLVPQGLARVATKEILAYASAHWLHRFSIV